MRSRNRPSKKKNAGKKKSTSQFIQQFLLQPRGFLMKPVQRFVVVADFKFVMNGATVGTPYSLAYLHSTSPTKANNGAATTVSMWTTVLTALMRKFLVTHIKIEIEVVSQETYPTILYLSPVNFQPPSTIAEAQLSIIQPHTRKHELAGVGSPNKVRLDLDIDLHQYGGFRPRGAEDSHWGGLNPASDPVDNMYAHIILDTNGVASVAGALATVRMSFIGLAAELNQNL